MNRIWTLALLLALPVPSYGQSIKVKSGEHADFSRVVLQFETPRDWQFGRVKNGYELRVDAPSATLDVSDIFKFIPKSRIGDVSTPGPGRLKLVLACRCIGDAFEIRPGRLVVDISSGTSAPKAKFEKFLPALAEGSAWSVHSDSPPSPVEAPPRQTAAPWWANFGDLGKLTIGSFSQADAVQSQPEMVTQPMGDSGATVVLPGTPPPTGFPVIFGELDGVTVAGQPATSSGKLGQKAKDSGAPLDNSPESAPTAAATGPPSRRDFRDPTDPFGRAGAASERVAIAKRELLRQLARASTQGLVRVEPPVIAVPIRSPAESPAAGAPSPASADAGTDPVALSKQREHLRIETALDRDRVPDEKNAGLSATGANCLEQSLFDVPAWGPKAFPVAPFGELRTQLVQEFDKPDPASIAALAQRYIYLGFGAEAKTVLNGFDTSIPNSDILMEMSELEDFGVAKSPGRLSGQISCSTDGAMWAVLSVAEIPKGALVDKRSVLRTFSALPPHLRQLLGPGLAKRFLGNGDIDTATAVRDFIDRSTGDRDAGFQMLQAELDVQDGNTSKALEVLANVAVTGSDLAGEAVAQLIETKLDTGLEIDPKTAQLADTLAVENRGTELGRRLTRAAILGSAVSGQVETTFDRIETAVKNGDVTSAEARDLRARAHLQNARASKDSAFLRTFFRHEPAQEPASPIEADALRAIAERLVGLDLPQQALALYSDTKFDLGARDHQIMASAQLAMGDAGAALTELAGLQDQASQLLRAGAEEMLGQYTKAAKIFAALDLPVEQSSAAWRAGDWPAVARSGTSIRSQAAALFVDAQTSAVGQDGAGIVDPSAEPVAYSRNLVLKSLETRAMIEKLLK